MDDNTASRYKFVSEIIVSIENAILNESLIITW